jgi:type IV secretory pathway component VirB8
VAAIIAMMPLKQIEVRYVEFANDSHVTPKIYSSKLDSTSKALLVRSFLRNYVVDRHSVDKVSEVPRFRRVRAMSNNRIFQVHKDIYFEVEKGLAGGTRDIRITYDQALSDGLHEIEFETIDERGGEVTRREWVVKIKYQIPDSYEVTKEEELLNPMGLTVYGYHFTQKEKQGA